MSQENFDAIVNLSMLLALVAGIAIWYAKRYGGLRGRIAERVRNVAITQPVSGTDVEEVLDTSIRSRAMALFARIGDRLPLFDAKYRMKLQKEMIRGGYRSKVAVSVLLATKFVTGLICATAMVMLGSNIPVIGGYPAVRGILMLGVFVAGMIVPEYILAFLSMRRRTAIESCLPDALDLLVICTNAGNSLGVSIRRVADEMKAICPPLSDELSLTADELKLSGDNMRALQALGERIDLPSVRALISTLNQSMKYGTPITQALRTLSRTERLAHMVSLEEKAAKLAPKMVVPMMIFILPAVMVISAGPSIIQLMDALAKQ
ncbi:type II secretion system F family protein [Caballeronia sp. LZ062]|uniref:type II secretion system F family protein n=1 Tax=unclassified Caballeronia TaxID=2646786 RepID=UPI00285D1B28|nr:MULTISPECIES: type II secretion system F family protein [unclassified Caballeronia]MDR5857609.1 type II secretion system F family protein [Caballeronia sp. LZ050]MDR5869159.1 type II secretion system F family protein [Caballeronia sp. LZ062]